MNNFNIIKSFTLWFVYQLVATRSSFEIFYGNYLIVLLLIVNNEYEN
jgi:hypothetical protein